MQSFYEDALRALLKRWRFIAGITAAVAVLSILLALLSPQSYRAETALIVSDFALGDGDGPGVEPDLQELLPEPLSPKVYAEMLESPGLLGDLRVELEKRGAFDGKAPDFESFRALLDVSYSTVDPTSRPVTYSPILRLSAKADDPELASEIVEAWADKAMALSERVKALRYGNSLELFRQETERSQTALEKVRQELAEEKGRHNLEVLLARITHTQSLLADLELRRQEAQRRLASAEEGRTAVQAALEGEPERIQVFRAPSDTAYFIVTEQERGRGAEGIAEKGMVDEQINPIYVALRQQEKDLALRVAESQGELASIERQEGPLRQTLEELMATYAEHQAAQARLSAEEEIAQTLYRRLASTANFIEVARALATGSEGQGPAPLGLNRLDDGIYPERDSGWMGRKARVVALTALAFFVAAAAAIFLEWGLPRVRALAAASPAPASGAEKDPLTSV